MPLGRLTPYVRVIPTWTDPTVRRASEAIGGPMCRHALVGQIGQRLPNDHLVVRVVFPASGVPADRGRPARPAVLGRSASCQGAPPGDAIPPCGPMKRTQ